MMDEQDFEQQLRDALRPVEAPRGLADRIVAKAESRSRRNTRQVWVRWGALAAMLTVGTFGGLKWNEKRQADQIEARRAAEQFTLAMSITTRKVAKVQQNLVVEIPLGSSRSGQ